MSLCPRPEHAAMERRLDRIDRRVDACCATGAAVTAALGTGSLVTALYQYGMVQDGPMTTAGAALATALYAATGWIAKKVRKRRRARADAWRDESAGVSDRAFPPSRTSTSRQAGIPVVPAPRRTAHDHRTGTGSG
ncbi:MULTISPECIES: hypothetical protein [Streptomyces]|uniref:Uncharacterized protein n=2 Tax=Streptomyces TaxID=1883 RepID=A0ABQ7FJI0_9ACTN|nr:MULTISPECIES: hypothetical protein [Streptomyces]KAF4408820.1 hypothetical protein GCU69_12285 [Streptomyces lycii]PGH47435.1 hypothetical protein CRI70_28520 [Streptomyces sp. Ru87]